MKKNAKLFTKNYLITFDLILYILNKYIIYLNMVCRVHWFISIAAIVCWYFHRANKLTEHQIIIKWPNRKRKLPIK